MLLLISVQLQKVSLVSVANGKCILQTATIILLRSYRENVILHDF